eukprot:gnl/MRDRNA2_/MRDRNA2_70271_c0_seq1.p1 gnl/MRDRNA2_/MRDRNA2_70271_c0~~gnl/MRDRNA2_/MRDRNA2_70271_c0_seq1.p1  ORF type:complete len:274 (-),score=22.61 gnl/MRDRNA2_/MRDRNA2_70271_c0_seq1:20-841(-)
MRWTLACISIFGVNLKARSLDLSLDKISDNGVAFPLQADNHLVARAMRELDLSRDIGTEGLIDIHNLNTSNGSAMLQLGRSKELVMAASEALRRLTSVNASSIAGSSLALISSDLFCKPAGQSRDFIGWHQDQSWWKVRPSEGLVNCWVAFDATTKRNSCVQYIKGSHHDGVQNHSAQVPGNQLYWSVDVPAEQEQTALCAELRPAEFTVFSGLVVHSSPPNSGVSRRCGVVFRYTTWPAVLDHYELDGKPYYPRPLQLQSMDTPMVNTNAEL